MYRMRTIHTIQLTIGMYECYVCMSAIHTVSGESYKNQTY